MKSILDRQVLGYLYPTMFNHFTLDEFACKETGENHIDPAFVALLDILRDRCGFPIVITSGYRSPNHSIEKAKSAPGMHTTGRAADVAVSNGHQRYEILKRAFDLGFTGIGVHKGFIHLDTRQAASITWLY